MQNTFMKDTFKTICLALVVGALAGAGAATYVQEVDTHSKPGHLNTDATGRPPKFWGLQVGSGDFLTSIGVYSDRTAAGAKYVAPAHTVNSSPRLPE